MKRPRRVGKVWALVSDPKRTGEWLPKEIMEIDSVEIVKSSAAGKLAGAMIDSAIGGGSNAGKNLPTHVYHTKSGKTLEMQTTDAIANKKCAERVVGGTDDTATMFKSMSWGMEMEPAEGNKTKLTMLSKGEAAKPVCNFVHHLLTWAHMTEKFNQAMVTSIETVAKK